MRTLTRRIAAAAVAVGVPLCLPLALPGVAAAAPANCTTGVHLAIGPTIHQGGPDGAVAPKHVARVGDAVDFAVSVSLLATDCPISDTSVTLTLPDGTAQTLTNTLALSPGGSQTFSQSDAGLTLYRVRSADIATGTFAGSVLADAAVSGTATETNSLQVPVRAATRSGVPLIRPETTLTKTASPVNGPAPLTVTYTFLEKNVSPDTVAPAITLDGITNPSVTDSDPGCTPTPTVSGGFNIGDADQDSTLDVGETWTFTCTQTLADQGTFSDTASATGTAGDHRPAGTVDSEGAPADESAGPVSVVVGPPPPTSSSTATSSTPTTSSTPATGTPTSTPTGTPTGTPTSTPTSTPTVPTSSSTPPTTTGTPTSTPSSTPSSTPPTSSTAPAAPTTTGSTPPLASTGVKVAVLLTTGLLIVACGIALTVAARRRHQNRAG